MSFYEDLVMQTQQNYSRYYRVYMSGGTAVALSKKDPLPYEEQIQTLAKTVAEAECIVVGGASGLSAAGGGDFYYEDNESFRKYFGKYEKKNMDLTGLLPVPFSMAGRRGKNSGDIWQPFCILHRLYQCGSLM